MKTDYNNYQIIKEYEKQKLDLINRDELNKFFKKENFDYVFHFAAQAGVRFSLDNPEKFAYWLETKGVINKEIIKDITEFNKYINKLFNVEILKQNTLRDIKSNFFNNKMFWSCYYNKVFFPKHF